MFTGRFFMCGFGMSLSGKRNNTAHETRIRICLNVCRWMRCPC